MNYINPVRLQKQIQISLLERGSRCCASLNISNTVFAAVVIEKEL
ncbi:MAG: hypothetical protein ACQESU_06945 [Halobacteriota archaeon]